MFIEVLTQVLILFVLIMLGFVFTKTKLITKKGADCMTDIVLYIVTPCVVIKSYMREFNRDSLKGLLLSLAIAFGAHIVYILISMLMIRSQNLNRQKVLRFSAIFANCGFMALPLEQAILGDEGVFYGASFVAVFNLLVWSYGIRMMSGDKKYISPKKLFLNPGMLGIAIGLIVFLLSLKLPVVISESISYMAALNTPIPMLIIGFYLANSRVFEVLKDKGVLFATALRLLLLPALVVGLLYLCGVKGTLLVACAIPICSPTAALTTMFSAKFEGDTELSVGLVSLSSLLSIATMPIIISFAQYLS